MNHLNINSSFEDNIKVSITPAPKPKLMPPKKKE